MSRYRLNVLLPWAVMVTLGTSINAHAMSMGTTYSSASEYAHTEARAVRTISLPDRYRVVVDTGQGLRTVLMTNALSAAVKRESQLRDSTVIDMSTGRIVQSNVVNPYRIQSSATFASANSLPSSSTYKTLDQAIAATTSLQEVYIINRETGAIVYSKMDNYEVSLGTGLTPYQSLQDALAAARQAPQGSVYSTITHQALFTAQYDVYVNNQFVDSFQTLQHAIQSTSATPNSEIKSVSTNKDVWDNILRYNVYQNGVLVKQFSTEQEALAYVKGLKDVSVSSIATGAVVFSNVPAYVVEVGSNTVSSFTTESAAIAAAKALPNSVVIQLSTNQIVWSNAGAFGVYRYLQLVRSFQSEQAAITYAKTLDHVQVIETATHQVDYSNYPTSVSSPYGDTFTNVNGMVVDHWGPEVTTLAPAPSFMQSGVTYVSNDYDHWYAETPSGVTYVGQWENPYQTMNLETSSTLTAQEINAFFAAHAASNSVLQNSGAYFIEAEQAYGVNAQYLVAHAIIESAWGTSYFARARNNLFGYEAYTSNPNAAATFRSVEYDINFQAWFVRNLYLNPAGSFYNGPNLNGMNVDYATDPYWANSIARVMSMIAPYSQSTGSQPLMPVQSTRPFFPYPMGARGYTSVMMNVYQAPNDTGTMQPLLGVIPKGSYFNVYGDSPGWDKVALPSGQTGFVDWNQVSLQNVVEVNGLSEGGVLNVHQSNSLSSPVIDTVTNGQYLVLLAPSAGGFSEIVDGQGKKGYVNSQYVVTIH